MPRSKFVRILEVLVAVSVVLLILGLKKGQQNRWMKSAALLVKLIGIINTNLVVKKEMT